MSEAVALILILTYSCSLLFTLRTHRRLLGGEAHPLEGPVWSSRKALLILAAATVGVAIESELLVHAATETTEALGLTHPGLLGVCLSGSGPTVLALCTGAVEEISALLSDIYRRQNLPADIRVLSAHEPGSL